MTKFIFDSGYFDKTGRQTIGTTEPKVVNGDVAEAYPILQADQAQADLLHWGPCFTALGTFMYGSAYTGNFGGGAITSSPITVLVPPFADRLVFGIYAKGTGTITFNGNYPISVTNSTGDYTWFWGSLTENLIGVSAPTLGKPHNQTVMVAKDANLDIISIIGRYRISTETIA